LTVGATGSPALTYQWYQAGSGAIQGATQASYTTPVFTATGTQSFCVVVTNPLGQVQSSTGPLQSIQMTLPRARSSTVGQLLRSADPLVWRLNAGSSVSKLFPLPWSACAARLEKAMDVTILTGIRSALEGKLI